MFYYRSDGAMCAMLEISARVKASRETQSIDKDFRPIPDCCPGHRTAMRLRRNAMVQGHRRVQRLAVVGSTGL